MKSAIQAFICIQLLASIASACLIANLNVGGEPIGCYGGYTAETCVDLCRATPTCIAMAYLTSTNQCCPKAAVPNVFDVADIISAYLADCRKFSNLNTVHVDFYHMFCFALKHHAFIT